LLAEITRRIGQSIETVGLPMTLLKIARKPFIMLRNWRILQRESISERFEEIYRRNHWGSSESVSGAGATLEYTQNLRDSLPDLFEKFGIKTVFDAPCGDFNWMSLVVADTDISYVGGDIVKPLIDSLKPRETDKISFMVFDLTSDTFPNADLWLSRDCWFHLSDADLVKALKGFVASEIPYVLTTSEISENQVVNRDIKSGDYRPMDLFAEPYGFSKDTLHEIDDWHPPGPTKKMFLWHRNQVQTALDGFEKKAATTS
jgi:hypothetical protein